MTVDDALDVFCQAFSFTRSFTHPYMFERLGPLRVMRDGQDARGRPKRDPRNTEVVVYGTGARESLRLMAGVIHPKHAVCAILGAGDSRDVLVADWKAAGYRLNRTEALMICDLPIPGAIAGPAEVRRVIDLDDLNEVNRQSRARLMLPEHLKPGSPIRLYAASIDGRMVGNVRSIQTGEDRTWVAGMFVEEAFRRRGIARSLMTRMLADDHAIGAKTSVLLASVAGSKLYPVVGYRQIGSLLLFTPTKPTQLE
jgi:GNAT superfamily N-acetyltransferase